ncbi:MAG: NAD(P)/FAD-dependent oxidoreductase [Chroococcales cyanobacterium]
MLENAPLFDIAVLGAGLAGLTCAKALQRSGYDVVILEKSRGVGGRVATRRLHHTCVDHGLPYLDVQGEQTQHLIEQLHTQQTLCHWKNSEYVFKQGQLRSESSLSPRYIAPEGMTAIAKSVATHLKIWRPCRVTKLTPMANQWHLTLESPPEMPQTVSAKAIVLAIPAPQALALVAELDVPQSMLSSLQSVEFDPCLVVMAGYASQSELAWNAIAFEDHPNLAWISLESSKRQNSQESVFVVHSTAQFAQKFLDATDLQPAAQELLSTAAQCLFPSLNTPNWFQIHRWRYARPRSFLSVSYLETSSPLPLICCGDWCIGNQVENALHSGRMAASALENNFLPKKDCN